MIDLLLAVLVIAIVLWLVVWIVGQIPMPQPVRGVILVIVGILLLLYFLQKAGVTL